MSFIACICTYFPVSFDFPVLLPAACLYLIINVFCFLKSWHLHYATSVFHDSPVKLKQCLFILTILSFNESREISTMKIDDWPKLSYVKKQTVMVCGDCSHKKNYSVDRLSDCLCLHLPHKNLQWPCEL